MIHDELFMTFTMSQLLIHLLIQKHAINLYDNLTESESIEQ